MEGQPTIKPYVIGLDLGGTNSVLVSLMHVVKLKPLQPLRLVASTQ